MTDTDIDTLKDKLNSAISSDKGKKISKILGKLEGYPVTVDILLRSGIGKTVNSLRHHPVVGQRAKQLVSKWKSLAFGGDDDAADEPSSSGASSQNRDVSTPKPVKLEPTAAPNIPSKKVIKEEPVVREPPRKKKKVQVPNADEFTSNGGLSFNDILGLNDVVKRPLSSSPKPSSKVKQSPSPVPPVSRNEKLKVEKSKRTTASDKVYSEKSAKTTKVKQEPVKGEVKEEPSESEDGRPRLAPFVPPPSMVFDSDERYNRDYKPMVRVPSPVVDRRGRVPATVQNGSDDIGELIKTKKSKTQVFSGSKNVSAMRKEVPSLYQLSQQVLKDNVEYIEYTGGIPFDLLKDILVVATPEQLARIEEFNEYLILETEELWETHTRKAFPKAAREENESWREAYFRSVEEREERLRTISATISAKKAQMLPVRQTKLALAVAPREVRRRQEKYGTFGGERRMPSRGQDIAGHRRDTFDKRIDGDNASIKRDSYHVKPLTEPSPSAAKKPKIAPMMLKAKRMLGLRR